MQREVESETNLQYRSEIPGEPGPSGDEKPLCNCGACDWAESPEEHLVDCPIRIEAEREA